MGVVGLHGRRIGRVDATVRLSLEIAAAAIFIDGGRTAAAALHAASGCDACAIHLPGGRVPASARARRRQDSFRVLLAPKYYVIRLQYPRAVSYGCNLSRDYREPTETQDTCND